MPEEQTAITKSATVTKDSAKKRHKYAMWAFVLGVVSVVVPVLLPCAIVALVLGSIAIHQVNKDPEHLSGKGLAIAGVASAGTSFFGGSMMVVAIVIPLLIGGEFDDNDDTPGAEKVNIEVIKYTQPADVRGNDNNAAFGR